MFSFIVCGLLLSAPIVINANPIQNQAANLATRVRHIVHKADWAGVAGVMTAGQWAFVKSLAVADSESAGQIYFYLPFRVIPRSDDQTSLTLIFTERHCQSNSTLGCALVLIAGDVIKLEKGTDDYTHGLETYRSRHPTVVTEDESKLPERVLHLCQLDIKQINIYPGNGTIGVTPMDYSTGNKPVATYV